MINVTSFYFFVLLSAGVILYYIFPKKLQWAVLLACSTVYYVCAATPYTIIYLVVSTAIAYVSAIFMENEKRRNGVSSPYVLRAALAAVSANVAIWFFLKGSSYWVDGSAMLHSIFPGIPVLKPLPLVGALGMGYYTAQVIAYILDVYRDTTQPQRNPLKLFLFVCFFPQLTVGPISRYDDLKVLYEPHSVSYLNLCFGCQRILWGLFKKLVISDRLGIIVSGIWADTAKYNGIWIWAAVLLYPLRLYTDFSGCMDIILGAAELFDIHLRENFNSPFFARNTQEFWQRWHITLGTWARDYVYYPVLKSRFLISIGKKTKKKYGKRAGKLIPWILGMAVLWFVMGFWHGSVQHIAGVSLWFFSMLVLSELFKPLLTAIVKKTGIRTDTLSWHIFQSSRTYFVYSLGAVAFSAAGMAEAMEHYRLLIGSFGQWNPWVLFDSSVLSLGVTWQDINIILTGVLLLVIVAVLREKFGYARLWMKEQNLAFRWIIWIALFVFVVIYGLYGEGYDSSVFIYQGF